MDLSSSRYGRASFERDRGRRSGSTSRLSLGNYPRRASKSPLATHQGSSDSFVHSVEQATDSSVMQSATDTQASGSQILNRSDVFRSPPKTHSADEPLHSKSHRRSEDTTRSSRVHRQVPPRSHTTQGPLKPRARQVSGYTEDSEDMENTDADLQQNEPPPSLQDVMKAGTYPLQRAAGFAGYLKNQSKRMSTLLATESMGYVEKVAGMWQAEKRHYGDSEGFAADDRVEDPEEERIAAEHNERFRAHFALPSSEQLQATYFAHLHRVLPIYGKLYVSKRRLCFRSLLPGTRTKMVLPLKDIENVDKEKGFKFGWHGMVVMVRGHEELFFEFAQAEVRDDCAVTLLQSLESIRYLQESGLLSPEDKEDAMVAKAEHQMLQDARIDGHAESKAKAVLEEPEEALAETPPVLFDDPRASIINFKPTESLRITCLTIGSRGDVQPYIALCKGLLAEGHKPTIATHAEFEPWIRGHGIDFATVEGDPAELMRICVENGMFTYSFMKEATSKFRGWIDELLSSAWTACHDTDLLIESPSAMAGIHIAEALGIPYFRGFSMPWTRTRAYPHAFAVPTAKLGGHYNLITYVAFENFFWQGICRQVNKWRARSLGLPPTSLDKMQQNKVPFLYNISPHVVPPPLDYSDWIHLTGYWFLDEASTWTPSEALTEFIAKARADGKKIVYIGFGSIVVEKPAALTQTVVDSVLKADVRCILSKGWSDRLTDKTVATKPEIPLPPEILQIKSAPHDWLFSQIDAAAHHGGAGTTGASLRAGVPTIIKPFFGDQYFFGNRVEDLGVGIYLRKLNVSVFARALWEATNNQRLIVKAKYLGKQIRSVSTLLAFPQLLLNPIC